MDEWLDYPEYVSRGAGASHTVLGSLKVLPALWSPQLANRRDLLVYLPPSYADPAALDARSYPVLYMHDGQNLFDEATSYAGEWQVDETLQALSAEGLETIVVGIPNLGERRYVEYTPFPDETGEGGAGDSYLAFLVETVKPLVDRTFRTRPERAATGIAGSSLGGLISLYAFFRYPSVFGFAGAFSPTLEVGRDSFFSYVEQAPFAPGRLYLDVGTHEAQGLEPDLETAQDYSDLYRADVQRMRNLLISRGYRAGSDLLYVVEPGAVHHESAWARRLPAALRFLLSPLAAA